MSLVPQFIMEPLIHPQEKKCWFCFLPRFSLQLQYHFSLSHLFVIVYFVQCPAVLSRLVIQSFLIHIISYLVHNYSWHSMQLHIKWYYLQNWTSCPLTAIRRSPAWRKGILINQRKKKKIIERENYKISGFMTPPVNLQLRTMNQLSPETKLHLFWSTWNIQINDTPFFLLPSTIFQSYQCNVTLKSTLFVIAKEYKYNSVTKR